MTKFLSVESSDRRPNQWDGMKSDPSPEARGFARSLSLKVAWRVYCKSSERPINIPADPARIYKDLG